MLVGLLLGLNGCNSIGNEKAEFDGGYILAKDDSFIPIKETEKYVTQIIQAGMSIFNVTKAPKVSYTMDASTNAKISQNDIKGFFLKGDYGFKYLTIHHLEKKTLGKHEGLFENKGPATKDKPFYYPGKQLKLKKQKVDNGYYYILDEKIPAGKYVAWLGKSFWIFEVK
jgi:hypothetical protein